ncbi:MAG TPA: substrate-binding domain-containing protein [Planctomycetota bacterium]|mgnify:CR=1 FL=1|jgi:ribose transport system substrate-binding protein|nr:substrate-binding domain-containing protein [Planctomycetota bacterium]OQC19821.1 MAG: D-allose-binding periplasmic protein precursor [Planctomycetes bacterium ADurb.Bin069]HNS00119.1 substrate-binding domain-containing protein [Planctomycetota bacterium]HNU26630.1 substrate-binding domain-containing protein [Planctomycetota bacterium]HOE30191.1 substrate-binding domain-containing protein [Planctomycetota bacterium]
MMRTAFFSMVIILAICGCERGAPAGGTVNPGAAQTTGRPAHPDQLYIEVSAVGGSEYWAEHKLGLKLAGEALGVRTEYLGPADYDLEAMATALEQAIARRPQGLLVAGFEPLLEPIINKAVDAGIPVVTVDADLPASKRLAFVGTGNYQAGIESGKLMATCLGGKGKIAVTTMPGAPNLQDRVRGVRDAVAAYPQIEIVQVLDTRGDTITITQACVALLQKYPDLSGIVSVEAIGGVGAATATREAGKVGKIKIVAMDRSNDVLQGIKDGLIEATLVQQTALMPLYGLQILYNLNNVPIPISKDNKKAGVSGAPILIDTSVVVVDRRNCELFMR